MEIGLHAICKEVVMIPSLFISILLHVCLGFWCDFVNCALRGLICIGTSIRMNFPGWAFLSQQNIWPIWREWSRLLCRRCMSPEAGMFCRAVHSVQGCLPSLERGPCAAQLHLCQSIKEWEYCALKGALCTLVMKGQKAGWASERGKKCL